MSCIIFHMHHLRCQPKHCPRHPADAVPTATAGATAATAAATAATATFITEPSVPQAGCLPHRHF